MDKILNYENKEIESMRWLITILCIKNLIRYKYDIFELIRNIM